MKENFASENNLSKIVDFVDYGETMRSFGVICVGIGGGFVLGL